VTLTGNASDAEGQALTHLWELVTNPRAGQASADPLNPSQASTTVTVSSVSGQVSGTYVYRYCAGDPVNPIPEPAARATSSQCATVSVTVRNIGPLAVVPTDFSVPHAVEATETYAASFDLVGSGRDNEYQSGTEEPAYLMYSWSWNPAMDFQDPNVSVSFREGTSSASKTLKLTLRRNCAGGACGARPYPTGAGGVLVGTYRFWLTVTDTNGAASTPASVTVNVTNTGPGNRPNAGSPPTGPIAHTYVGVLGSDGSHRYQAQVPRSGQGTNDPEADPLTYEWYLGDPVRPGVCVVTSPGVLPPPCVSAWTATPTSTVTLHGPATLIGPTNTHQLCLRARDPWGLASPGDCVSVEVKNDPPPAPDPAFGQAQPTVNHPHARLLLNTDPGRCS